MWKFLCACIALLPVSGGDETVTITGVLGENVLLPCSCPDATVNDELRWQNEESKEKVYDTKSDKVNDRYRNRSKIFLSRNNNNCSIQLTNITAADQGSYRCSYEIKGLYKKLFVNLSISTTFNVCQSNETPGVFQCNATGRYTEAEIRWDSYGQPLTDSPSNNQTSKKTLDALTGTYHFTSSLTIKIHENITPVCNIKATRISVTQTDVCMPTGPAPQRRDPKRHHYLTIISFVLLVCFLVLILGNVYRGE